MSADQPTPHRTRTRTTGRQPRPARRTRTTESEGASLSDLRRRCVTGTGVTLGAYLAVVASTVVFPTALTLKQTISLELGLGLIAMLCSVVAIFAWFLTQNTAYVLSVARASTVASAANAALEAELLGGAGTGGPPIPIQRGRDIRQHRTDRHAG